MWRKSKDEWRFLSAGHEYRLVLSAVGVRVRDALSNCPSLKPLADNSNPIHRHLVGTSSNVRSQHQFPGKAARGKAGSMNHGYVISEPVEVWVQLLPSYHIQKEFGGFAVPDLECFSVCGLQNPKIAASKLFLHQRYQSRFTESQNSRGWKGPLGVI